MNVSDSDSGTGTETITRLGIGPSLNGSDAGTGTDARGSRPGPMIVMVSATPNIQRSLLVVRVLNGAAGIGATAKSLGAGPNLSITPQDTGSLVYGAIYLYDDSATSTWPNTAYDSNTSILEQDSAGTPPFAGHTGIAIESVKTTAGNPMTLGVVSQGSELYSAVALCEIIAAAGQTLAEDASTPLPVPSDNGDGDYNFVPLFTAEFAPPPGSTVVTIVPAEYQGVIGAPPPGVSDSTGLTWTLQVWEHPTLGDGNCSVWTAQVPPAAGYESATGTEAQSVNKNIQFLADTDSGTGADGTGSVVINLLVGDTDTATGTETATAVAGFGTVLGYCRFCHRPLSYLNPGDPPYDCITDAQDFYNAATVPHRDYSLIDATGEYWKFCPDAPPHPLGQFRTHVLGG